MIVPAAVCTSVTPAIFSAHGHQKNPSPAITACGGDTAPGSLTSNDGTLPSGVTSRAVKPREPSSAASFSRSASALLLLPWSAPWFPPACSTCRVLP